jgi:plastocyanin
MKLICIVLLSTLALAGGALAAADRPSKLEHNAEMDDFKFVPARLVVTKGQLVVWKNSDRARHNATSVKGLFATKTGGKDARLSARAPRKAGTYRYICSLHPQMKGTLVVR